MTVFGKIKEPAREIPVSGVFDVVVVGGGIAGVAAALAAARNGASVCIVERYCGLGGLATLGNVIIWLPICDGKGHQVIGGIGEELLKLSVHDIMPPPKSGIFHGIPECWKPDGNRQERLKKRYLTVFNPASYILSLEELVVNEGIQILYDTRFCGLLQEKGMIKHIIIENKSGRSAIDCRTVVDASGDADVCFCAGETTVSVDFNVAAGWHFVFADGALKLIETSNSYSSHADQNGATGPFYKGDNSADVTGQIISTRRKIRESLADMRAGAPQTDIQPIMLPSIACFRMTRRLEGASVLSNDHVHQWVDDAVCLTGDWRNAGPVYAIPYGALYGNKTRNLLVAGRCISTDNNVWDVTRVIPTCAVTGEAAGTAAALAAKMTDNDVTILDVHILQDQLKAQNMILDRELVI